MDLPFSSKIVILKAYYVSFEENLSSDAEPMFKLIILLTKKPTMTDDDFAEYMQNTHAPIAKKMPGLRKYVVNIVQKPPTKEPEYHGVAELWFDDRNSMKSAFSSPQGRMTQKDTRNFAGKTVTLFTDEHEFT